MLAQAPKSSMLSVTKLRRVPLVRTNAYTQCLLILSYSIPAIKIGVPVVPGTPGPVGDYTEANAFIEEYGFPGE